MHDVATPEPESSVHMIDNHDLDDMLKLASEVHSSVPTPAGFLGSPITEYIRSSR